MARGRITAGDQAGSLGPVQHIFSCLVKGTACGVVAMALTSRRVGHGFQQPCPARGLGQLQRRSRAMPQQALDRLSAKQRTHDRNLATQPRARQGVDEVA